MFSRDTHSPGVVISPQPLNYVKQICMYYRNCLLSQDVKEKILWFIVTKDAYLELHMVFS